MTYIRLKKSLNRYHNDYEYEYQHTIVLDCNSKIKEIKVHNIKKNYERSFSIMAVACIMHPNNRDNNVISIINRDNNML